MIIELLYDYPLRGVVLEHFARIVLRRRNKNNFIFCCKYFDSVDEIIKKYRLKIGRAVESIEYLRKNPWHSDLIEFELDDINERTIQHINFYDVKSILNNARRDYFEMCLSSYEFMTKIQERGCGSYIVPIIIYQNWRLDFKVVKIDEVTIRVYNSAANKTIFFSRPRIQ